MGEILIPFFVHDINIMDLITPSFDTVLGQAQQLSAHDRLRLSRYLLEQIEYEFAPTQKTELVQPKCDIAIARPLDDITYEAIGAAMDVHKELGPGYRENTYQQALEIKYANRWLSCTPQQRYEVFDAGQARKLIGYYIPDFVLENRVIVEIKALDGINSSHIAQVIGYLAVSKCEVGLLINFGKRSLEFRRILPPRNIQQHKPNKQWLFVPDGIKPINTQ